MTRNEKVYRELRRLCEDVTLEDIQEGFSGFDATTIGEGIEVNRSNTSKELNKLVTEKKIVKVYGKPVYYFDREKLEKITGTKLMNDQSEFSGLQILLNPQEERKDNSEHENNVFNKIIGSAGSLEVTIKQAKAAILYPPRGLHTLIIGPTGVGKTMFAEMMYHYASKNNRIHSDARFTIFNCAEYADNPQLLLSQLFGYVKGAFTGADKDKAGLVEKTNGGILLLDEVHRLSAEGQEMLFLLMDKNRYRRLGETENTREANVLLICATTEDIHSTLLKTFLRRIPMVIKIPSLSERPLKERLQLVKEFFKEQVNTVKVQIRVYEDVLKAFLLYDCQGNIGQLKGDIQLTCARGFLDYHSKGKKIIEIDLPLIPEHVYRGLFHYKENREEISKLLLPATKKYHEFSESNPEEFIYNDDYNVADKLYKEMKTQYLHYCSEGYSQEEINEMLNSHIEKYLQNLLSKFNVEKDLPDNQELFKIVSPRVFHAVEKALRSVEGNLQKTFGKKAVIALTLHMSALIERITENKPLSNAAFSGLDLRNKKELETAREIIKILEKELEISIPKEEITFIAMFFNTVDMDDLENNRHIGVMILAHGKNTASSIAEVANNLIGTDHCKAIDMPLEEKVEDVLNRAIQMVKEIDQGKGVLLLVDMGSLVAFGEIITNKTNIPTRCIEMVSTPIALEAVRKCLLPEMNIQRLAEEIQGVTPYIGRLVTENIKAELTFPMQKTIITTCVTGEGAAIKLAQLIKNTLSIIEEQNIKLRPMNLENFKNSNWNNTKDIIAVVGTMNLEIPHVPYIPIDEIIMGDGFRQIETLILRNSGIDMKSRETPMAWKAPQFNLILNILDQTLTFLNPVKAYNIVMESFEKLQNGSDSEYYKKLEIRYIFHTCCMIERILRGEALSYINIEELMKNKFAQYGKVRKAMEKVEEVFGVEIPDTEVGYIMDLLEAH